MRRTSHPGCAVGRTRVRGCHRTHQRAEGAGLMGPLLFAADLLLWVWLLLIDLDEVD